MRILVIGDSCIDEFVYGKITRLCPEAPVPVFNPAYTISNPGMAGNVAANLISLGVTADLVTNEEKIIKKRIVDERSNQMIVRIDEGDSVVRGFDIKGVDFSKYEAIVVSDYDKGFLNYGDLLTISAVSKPCFLDTKKILRGAYMQNFFFIKINEAEWERSKLAGAKYDEWDHNLIITKGGNGATYGGVNYPTEKVEVSNVAGAGDTFLAAFVVSYLKTNIPSTAIKFANECSRKVVQKKGVSTV